MNCLIIVGPSITGRRESEVKFCIRTYSNSITLDSDTVSTYQVSSVQLVTDKKLEAFNKALKRPDRSKQCHCLQFCYVHR